MSTVLLMTDSWQPTVLRLLPFAKNNARSLNSSHQRGQSQFQNQRGFPVLAVTRSHRKTSSSSGYRSGTPRSITSALSDHFAEQDDSSMISDSIVTCPSTHTDKTSGRPTSKYARKKIPDVHSVMKEAIKFSVQDLNDQASSVSGESKGDAGDGNKTINNRTRLPRPSMVTPGEGVKTYAAPMSVPHKFVTLTPGELELQKYRDNYVMEQVHKKKKYKLNVNQLPRSTTPINDHDPDKLNMKQVIAFLQTKAGNVPQKKITLEKKKDVENRHQAFSDRNYIDIKAAPVAMQKIASVETLGVPSSNPESRYVDKVGNTRTDTSGCVSVMSTKSSPNLPFRSGRQSVKSQASTSTKASVKSYTERAHRRGDRSKQKEFRLYRFLAIAPDNPIANNYMNTDQPPVIQKLSFKYSNGKEKGVGKSSSGDQTPLIKSRHQTTANLIHRRAVNKTVLPVTTEGKDSEVPDTGTGRSIRLPLVSDADAESADEECETCSTTSATCNSAERGSKEGERTSLPKKGKGITFSDDVVDVSQLTNIKHIHRDKASNMRNLQGFLDQSSNKTESLGMEPINSPRQIHVTMPHSHNAKYSQEIVRLTLRQAKTATRVTSYMSDLESDGVFKADDWRYQSADDAEGVTLTGYAQPTHPENKEWIEHSRQFVNNISNNNFIKVRQKLKASTVSNVE